MGTTMTSRFRRKTTKNGQLIPLASLRGPLNSMNGQAGRNQKLCTIYGTFSTQSKDRLTQKTMNRRSQSDLQAFLRRTIGRLKKCSRIYKSYTMAKQPLASDLFPWPARINQADTAGTLWKSVDAFRTNGVRGSVVRAPSRSSPTRRVVAALPRSQEVVSVDRKCRGWKCRRQETQVGRGTFDSAT
jgi:hypothetical protein